MMIRTISIQFFLRGGLYFAGLFCLVSSSLAEEVPDSLAEAHHHLLSRSHDYVLIALILVSIALLIINYYRRKSQMALKESEARFQALAERSMVGISVVQDGICKFANPRLAEMFGTTQEEMIDRTSPLDFVHPEDRDIIESAMRRRIEGEEEFSHYEVRFITVQGETRDVEVFGSRMIYRGRPALVATLLDITERKRTQQDLLKAHSDLRQIFNSSVPLYVVDKDFTILQVNDTFCSYLGRSPEELTGGKCYDVWPGSSCGTPQCAMRRILAGEEKINYEREHVRIDGCKSAFVASARAYRGPEGDVAGMIASFSDVTELKERETALRVSEEKSRAQFMSIPVPTYLWQWQQDDFVLIDYNGAALAITDGKIGDFVGVRFKEMFPKWPDWHKDMVRCLEEKANIQWDEPYLHRFVTTGGERMLHVSYAFVPPDQVMVHTADVTERTRAQEALRESESRFRAISERSPVGIYMGQGSKIIYTNPAVENILGYSFDEVVKAEKPLDYVHPDDRSKVIEAAEGFKSGKLKSLRFEVRVFARDGSTKHLEIFTSATIYQGLPTNIGTVLDVTERKEAERALAESEEKFRLAMDATNDALWDWDMVTNKTYRNLRHATMLGYQPEEMSSDQSEWEDRIHPDDRKVVFDAMRAHCTGETDEVIIEYRLKAKDGKYIWILGRGKVTEFDSSGRPVRMVGTNIDITKRKEAEQALKESEDRFKILAEQSPVGIYVMRDGRFIYTNDKISEILGYSGEELLSLPDVNQVAHEEERQSVIDFAEEFRTSSERSTSLAFRIVTGKGDVKHVEIYSSKIMYEGKPAHIGTLMDVTKRFEAERALKESERKFRAVAETANAAIIIYDENGLLYSNPAVETISGYTQKELMSMPLIDLVRTDFREALEERARKRAAGVGSGSGSFEIPIVTKSGKEKWVLYSGSSISYGGRPVQLGAGLDITQRKAIEGQLQDALRERYTQVAEVAGGVAHEIYNALFPAKAVLDKLKERMGNGDSDGERNPQLVGLAEQSVERAIQMTELVTQFSRLDWDKDVEIIDLNGLIRGMIDEDEKVRELEVKVRLDIDEGASIEMNRVHAISLLSNLIKNSLDALEDVTRRELAVSVRVIHNRARIEVADTGCGIPSEMLSKVFSPFVSSKPRTGTGLGLAICKRIVDIYDGEITVESVLDRGTTFSILI